MSSMSLRAKKKMASKLAKTAKGEEMIQKAMGADGVALLKALNATATAKYGAKEAKTLKTDLYTMMMKFQIHAEVCAPRLARCLRHLHSRFTQCRQLDHSLFVWAIGCSQTVGPARAYSLQNFV